MLSQKQGSFLSSDLSHLLILISLAGLLLLISACGGGSAGDVAPPTPSPTSVQFKVGDAPADRLIALEVNFDALHLKNSAGDQINVLPASRRLEFLHIAGTLEPVALLEIPQGTYSEATIQGSNIHVSYVSQTGSYPGIAMDEVVSSSSESIVVPISPPLTVGSAPMIVNIDFNVASFISFDPQTDLPILNDPQFTFSASSIKTSGQPKPEEGGLEDTIGIVTATSSTDFLMDTGQNGMPLTFKTDNNTVYINVSFSTLPTTIVKASGVTQSDGSILATAVEGLQNQYGVETEGVVYFNWGETPTTWFWLTPQDGNGAGFEFTPTTAIGQVVNVQVSPGTAYAINTDGMDMTSANFPFDANADPSTLRFGQRVRVESSTGMISDNVQGTSGLIAAQKVTLDKQSVTGTVFNYQTSGGRAFFVVQLPADSYLTILNSVQPPSATYINVWQQAGTDLHGLSTVNNGDTVSVRGLLFSSQGAFVMVAERIWK
jgi:hypothetical protein